MSYVKVCCSISFSIIPELPIDGETPTLLHLKEYSDEYHALDADELKEIVQAHEDSRTSKVTRCSARSRVQDLSNVSHSMAAMVRLECFHLVLHQH